MTRAPTMTCVQFFDRVLRLKLTIGQRAFVAVAIDRRLPRELRGAAREAAIAMFGDIDEVPPVAYRTLVSVMGRDSGKTQMGAGIAVYLMMTAPLTGIGPGDLPTVGIVSPSVRTSRIAFRRAIALVHETPELKARLVGETKESFILRRHDGREVGLEVFAASLGGRALRGPTFIAVLFDEAAQFRDKADAQVNDSDLYAAAMPRIKVLALFLSTPWAQEGLFFKLASENHGAPRTALVAQASTLLMRDNDPAIQAAIEFERERDPDNCQREFFAEFMASGSSMFFDPRAIDDAIDDELGPGTHPDDDEAVFFGGDVGLVRDASALVGLGAKGAKRDVLRILTTMELRPSKAEPLKLSKVISSFAGVLKSYDVRSFLADGHAREPAREWAAEEEISIMARPEGAGVLHEAYVTLRQAFNDRRIRIPRDPRLLAQLRSVTVRPLPGGTWKVTIPRRVGQAHGDLVAALVCAVQAAAQGDFRRPGDPSPFSIVHAPIRSRFDERDVARPEGLPSTATQVRVTTGNGTTTYFDDVSGGNDWGRW